MRRTKRMSRKRLAVNTIDFCECGDTRWIKAKKWEGGFVKTFVGYVSVCAHCGAEWENLRSEHHRHE